MEKKVEIEREKIVLAAMPELQLQIVEFTREHGRVTIGETIKLTGTSRNTLKQHFRALVERGKPKPARQGPVSVTTCAAHPATIFLKSHKTRQEPGNDHKQSLSKFFIVYSIINIS